MRCALACTGVSLLVSLCHGQTALPPDRTVDLNEGYRNKIEVTGLFDYNANTVYNELPLAILRGGYLPHDLRQRSLQQLHARRNRIGQVLQARVQWTGAACWGKRQRWRPLVSVAHHVQSGLSFTADAYDLAFFGNASFQGRTAILGPSGYTQVRYQTIGAGLTDAHSGSYVRLDLVRGGSLSVVEVDWATLFTGIDGQVLRTNVLGNYSASDTAGRDIGRHNGLGAALSGRWSFRIRPDQKVQFNADLEDLGMVVWNDRSVRIAKDTTIRYEGLRVNDLFALDAMIVNEATVLDTFGLRYSHGEIRRMLPFHASLEAVIPIAVRWRLSVQAEHRHLPGYLPQATTHLSRTIGQRTMVGASVSYGGFGGLRAGLAVKHRLGEHLLVCLSSPQVPAFLLPRARGAGLLLGINLGF